jgi:hypothetical protein
MCSCCNGGPLLGHKWECFRTDGGSSKVSAPPSTRTEGTTFGPTTRELDVVVTVAAKGAEGCPAEESGTTESS